MSPDDIGDANTMRFAVLPEKTVPLPAIEFAIFVLPMVVADLSNPFMTAKPVPVAGLYAKTKPRVIGLFVSMRALNCGCLPDHGTDFLRYIYGPRCVTMRARTTILRLAACGHDTPTLKPSGAVRTGKLRLAGFSPGVLAVTVSSRVANSECSTDV